MKKMKLAVMHGIGKELTRDELKNVFGGSDPQGSGSGSIVHCQQCVVFNSHGQFDSCWVLSNEAVQRSKELDTKDGYSAWSCGTVDADTYCCK